MCEKSCDRVVKLEAEVRELKREFWEKAIKPGCPNMDKRDEWCYAKVRYCHMSICPNRKEG
jgi:hypothetical protein